MCDELYSKQTGQVVGRSISKTFELEREAKQGDPLSQALFNALLESVLGPLQVAWRVPTEFPLCPNITDEKVLEIYLQSIKFGEVFSRNDYSVSKVVKASQYEDSIVVLTNISNSPKSWGVVHLSADEEFVYHKSIGTYFELTSALKEFCEFTGQSYDDGIDDYA